MNFQEIPVGDEQEATQFTEGETTMKHTAGPWKTEPNSGVVTWAYGEAKLIGPRWEANAKLIATAPELLEALEDMIADSDGGWLRESPLAKQVLEVIAKATLDS